MLGPDDLVCSHFTLTGASPMEPARFGFAERVAAAGAAGFAGIGLLGFDYALARAGGLSDADIAAVLDDHGVVLAEVEFLMDWSAGPEETARVRSARLLEDRVWAMADALGPRVVSAGELVGPEQTPELSTLVDRFGALCDRAAAHGLRVALEFTPWSGIPDVATAATLVREVDRANAGVNVDAWHWFRGRPDPSALRSIADRVFVVQIDDADDEVIGTLLEDTNERRRLPGEGVFDLVGFVTMLDGAGVRAPLSVEVMSATLRDLPVAEAARRAHDATRGVVRRARP
ncbi:MAG: sugar phosphate isomerase [Acidimicrobiia bacterium]